MKKMLLILLTFCALQLQAQKVTTVYGCNAKIIYKSKDDFKIPYLQYYRAMLYPGYESKTMRANPSGYKQIEMNHQQIVISRNFKFGKNETFDDRLQSLDKYLTKHKNKLIKIDIINGMIYEIEGMEASQLISR